MDLQTGTEDTNTSEAATLLTEMGVAFFARPDGLLEVQGNINLNNRRLTSLPDLSQVIVRGSFSCMNNEITSLKGAPRYVGKNFWCANNRLTTLEGGPKHVGTNFHCHNNKLDTLQGAPEKLGSGLYCKDNNLSSLEGAPVSLDNLWAHDNPLTSLEGAPKEFKSLATGCFGDFHAWDEIPATLLVSDKTRRKIEEERLAREREARKIIKGLDHPLRAPKRASFKKSFQP